MTSQSVLVLLALAGLGALSVTALVTAVRGGRGPADPPASHPRSDPAGFPVLSQPRGVLHRRPRAAARPAATRTAAAAHTARLSRTARPMSPGVGVRPLPSTGRSSTRLP